MRIRTQFICSALVIPLFISGACSRQSPTPDANASQHKDSVAIRRDLSVDEGRGGHTLRKHVGLSDDDLRERLRREPGISAASTYTDRNVAELSVGRCIGDKNAQIARWLARERHPNLALDCALSQPVGRSFSRRSSGAEACANTKVVLKWTSDQEYYVLTSYPDCR